MKDIVPELLEKVQSDFEKEISSSSIFKKAIKAVKNGTATYEDANAFAELIGDTLANAIKTNISSDVLPDGKMYYNIADRIVGATLKQNYELVSDYAKDVQTILNKKAGLNVKGIKTTFNKDKAKGIINRLATEELFENVEWILQEPVVNFTQSVIDDSVKTNADFHHKLGLKPRIERISTGKCCEWCNTLAGIYSYPDVPKDVYRRHRFCRCTVEYDPATGKRQNVHTKKWIDPKRNDKIDKRIAYTEKEESNRGLNKETRINRKKIFSNKYDSKFSRLKEGKKVIKEIRNKSKEILVRRDGTKFEDLLFVDSDTGKSLISKNYHVENTSKPTKAMLGMIKNTKKGAIIGIHNHPNSTIPSINDIVVSYERKYKYGIIIGHDGTVIKYKGNRKLSIIEIENYNIKFDKFYQNGYNNFEDFSKDLKNTFDIDMEVLI